MTPIKVAELESIVKEYPDKETAAFLVQGFKEGFKIGFKGERKSFQCDNLDSANQNLPELRAMILKELMAGRVEGPFRKELLPLMH